MSTHTGTHIDALCHQAVDLEFYGGVPAEESVRNGGYAEHGVEHIGPIVARGVLLDVARHRGVDSLVTNGLVSAKALAMASDKPLIAINPKFTLTLTGNQTGSGGTVSIENNRAFTF